VRAALRALEERRDVAAKSAAGEHETMWKVLQDQLDSLRRENALKDEAIPLRLPRRGRRRGHRRPQRAHRAALRLKRADWRQCAGITSTCRPDGVSAA
jgi:hypothetical protein